jgi:V8-like Glu-specific endopeptidase
MIAARTSRTVRATLLASAAGFCLIATPAFAGEDPPADAVTAVDRPSAADVVREAQSGGTYRLDAGQAELAPQKVGYNRVPIDAVRQPEIVIANPNTTVTDRDPVNVTGVGQMIVDEQNGFIGLCTGTLINPRTVIFAAHCVNERAANAYGQNSGGQPIGFGFSNSNNTAGASAFGGYLGNYATNISRNMYDVNYVAYNPHSLEPDAAGFLYADVAIASLDTPAANVPTWALLLSALPGKPITAASGAGYHVTIEGYGNNGTASTGSTGGIDYRRRIAENFIGGLASLDQFENFLFGGAASSNPQNLYWIDFDDPRRDNDPLTPAPSAFDFNAWRDNAVPGVPGVQNGNSQEGITASGDSGGPLILDNTFAKKFVIGVLSGGYTRFFNGQPANGYGTAAFYQPLYLYWDWIAANNPYHYVSSVAGNGNWTDPTHWVTNIDPNYYVLDSNGNPINGVPGSLGAGQTGNTGTWGQACFQSGGVSDCMDMSNGTETVEVLPIGGPYPTGGDAPSTGGLGNDMGTASVTGLINRVEAEAQSGGGSSGTVTTLALPPATLDNGLPGATNFVPNNYDGDRFLVIKPRYFDVTLAASGTTTLNTAVNVDRFTIAGGGAMLDITSTGTLTSLMNINQVTGTMQVNGSLNSVGDYLMITGGLNGSGYINSPFFTNMAGTVAPGTANGGVGTLTFRGNIVLSSASTLMIDLVGSNLTNDKVTVNTGAAGSGIANVGGRVLFHWDASLRGAQTYTFVNAQNAVTGTFQTPAAFSAILYPELRYQAKTVQVYIQTGLYRNLFNPATDPNGYAWGLVMDQNRGAAGRYDGLYGLLDLQDAATVRATLDSFAPTTETTIQSLGVVAMETTGGFIRDRLASLDTDSLGGGIAHYGAPIQMASLGGRTMNIGADVRTDVAPQYVSEGVLPETMSGFVAGGYINGDSAPMTWSPATGRDNFDGWYAAAGLEGTAGDGVIGLAFSYTSLDGTGGMAGQSAKASLAQLTLYGKVPVGGLTLDAQAAGGIYTAKTRRDISFLGTPFSLTSRDNAWAAAGEVGLGKDIVAGGVTITPRAAFRATSIGFTPTAETGGPMALTYNRGSITSVQGRGGITLAGNSPKFKPYINGTWVHDFEGRPGYIGANLVGGIPGNSAFTTNVADTNYAEVSGGLTYTSGRVDLSISAMTTVARDDVSAQAYRGSIAFRF